ncbi:MAG TPA: biotin/lipoyl-containing protein [Myxococcota bacterium]|nr:biotin/lipoyl-containing protein [Myxococcota bacterium]
MSDRFLICDVIDRGNVVELKSPKIGRAILRVKLGEAVLAGQIIADFWCLGQHYLLKTPANCSGTVSQILHQDRIISLAYGDVFLHVARDVVDGAKKSSGEEKTRNVITINAPMDGMFYLSSSPDSPPYVNVSDTVVKGQTLGLIEVMKSFYPLKYQGEKPARISAIHIKTGTPVTSSTPIFSISIVMASP